MLQTTLNAILSEIVHDSYIFFKTVTPKELILPKTMLAYFLLLIFSYYVLSLSYSQYSMLYFSEIIHYSYMNGYEKEFSGMNTLINHISISFI